MKKAKSDPVQVNVGQTGNKNKINEWKHCAVLLFCTSSCLYFVTYSKAMMV